MEILESLEEAGGTKHSLRCFLKEKLFDGSQTNTDHFVSTWHAWFFMDTTVDRSRIVIGQLRSTSIVLYVGQLTTVRS